jgi:23S rRNA pseudouridine1911/1915/1917 synthase
MKRGGGQLGVVPPGLEGRPLDRAVREVFGLSWGDARAAIGSGKVFRGSSASAELDASAPVRAGEALAIRPRAPRPHVTQRASFERRRIVMCDASVIVVDKPAGISTVAFGDESPADARMVLDALIGDVLSRGPRRAPLGVVHRLDKETSGLVVFARTVAAKKHLANQFRHHTTTRRYLALVHGEVRSRRTIRSYLIEDRGDGLRGSAREGRREGRLAITHVEPVRRAGPATLVGCRLETGRTHQIRIHLAEAGHPLVGERVYVRDYAGPRIEAPRLMLHAAELGFEHPTTGERMSFTSELPDDFRAVLERLTAR